MISYELAKELKDAGFPNLDVPDLEERPMRWPTLSELIEACGDSFSGLIKMTECWSAASVARLDKIGIGSTPEIAVARLWLAVNKTH